MIAVHITRLCWRCQLFQCITRLCHCWQLSFYRSGRYLFISRGYAEGVSCSNASRGCATANSCSFIETAFSCSNHREGCAEGIRHSCATRGSAAAFTTCSYQLCSSCLLFLSRGCAAIVSCSNQKAVQQLSSVFSLCCSCQQFIQWGWAVSCSLHRPVRLLQSVIGVLSEPVFRFVFRSWLYRTCNSVRIHSNQIYVNIWKARPILELWRWGRSDQFWYLHHSSTSSSSVRRGGGEREGSLKGQQCEIWQLCKLNSAREWGWTVGTWEQGGAQELWYRILYIYVIYSR